MNIHIILFYFKKFILRISENRGNMLISDTMSTNCISENFKRTTTLWSKSTVSTLGTNCNPSFFSRDHPKSAVSTLGTNCNPRFFCRDHPKFGVSTLGTNCNPRFFSRDHPKSSVSTQDRGTNYDPRLFIIDHPF